MPVTLQAYFKTTVLQKDLLGHFQAVTYALRGEETMLERTHHQRLDDRNHSGYPANGQTYEAQWQGENTTLHASVQSGTGNPRDGYEYDVAWRVEVEHTSGPVMVTLNGSSWDSDLTSVSFQVQSRDASTFDLVHTALAARLEDDQSIEPYPGALNAEALFKAGDVKRPAALIAAITTHGGEERKSTDK